MPTVDGHAPAAQLDQGRSAAEPPDVPLVELLGDQPDQRSQPIADPAPRTAMPAANSGPAVTGPTAIAATWSAHRADEVGPEAEIVGRRQRAARRVRW